MDRGRLAPSPTGVLHLGNARSFLLAWLEIRSTGGELLLRIEDIDGPRLKAGATDSVLEDLRWIGLDWDGEPTRQSARLSAYRAAFETLRAAGQVYPCTCSRRDVEEAASAPHGESRFAHEGPLYPGTCHGRWRSAEEARNETGCEPAWRFRTPDRSIEFRDRFLGPVRCNPARELGDFVIWKRDGVPAYQLAVVVDDAAQQMTHVLRGDDLVASTPRQLLLYEALGSTPPSFAHTPLVVGQDGRRLAKRHGDTTLARFRQEGSTPEEIVGLLAAWSGLNPRGGACRPEDLVERWSLERVPPEPPVWVGIPPR